MTKSTPNESLCSTLTHILLLLFYDPKHHTISITIPYRHKIIPVSPLYTHLVTNDLVTNDATHTPVYILLSTNKRPQFVTKPKRDLATVNYHLYLRLWHDELDLSRTNNTFGKQSLFFLTCVFCWQRALLFIFQRKNINCQPLNPAEETNEEGRNVRTGLCPVIFYALYNYTHLYSSSVFYSNILFNFHCMPNRAAI